jgi:hypothetical protein
MRSRSLRFASSFLCLRASIRSKISYCTCAGLKTL